MRWLCVLCLLVARLVGNAALINFDFSDTPIGTTPKGFTSARTGEGPTGSWEVIQAEVVPALPPMSDQAPRTAIKRVLTQTDHDPTDERFPMLIYEGEEFGDFTLTTRFRLVGGEQEQMAGIAFRVQDADNYYVIRASVLGQNIRFYKVVAGLRGKLIGPSISISSNDWHELTIQCRGSEILCKLDGSPAMPPLQDASFSKGKVAFWTKSDSDCQFDGASISYIPTVPLSKQVLTAALEKYGRVIDLRLYALTPDGKGTKVVAAKNPEDEGESGESAELGAITDGNSYVGKDKGTVIVVMPVRDRNGEPVAAARVVMDSFPGQTDSNAIVRARPIIKLMSSMVESSMDPFK